MLALSKTFRIISRIERNVPRNSSLNGEVPVSDLERLSASPFENPARLILCTGAPAAAHDERDVRLAKAAHSAAYPAID